MFPLLSIIHRRPLSLGNFPASKGQVHIMIYLYILLIRPLTLVNFPPSFIFLSCFNPVFLPADPVLPADDFAW